MSSQPTWAPHESAAFCNILKLLWDLEKGLPAHARSLPESIFAQASQRLAKSGIRKSKHVCHGQWYYRVRHSEEFRDTFGFDDPPPPNSRRNEGSLPQSPPSSASQFSTQPTSSIRLPLDSNVAFQSIGMAYTQSPTTPTPMSAGPPPIQPHKTPASTMTSIPVEANAVPAAGDLCSSGSIVPPKTATPRMAKFEATMSSNKRKRSLDINGLVWSEQEKKDLEALSDIYKSNGQKLSNSCWESLRELHNKKGYDRSINAIKQQVSKIRRMARDSVILGDEAEESDDDMPLVRKSRAERAKLEMEKKEKDNQHSTQKPLSLKDKIEDIRREARCIEKLKREAEVKVQASQSKLEETTDQIKNLKNRKSELRNEIEVGIESVAAWKAKLEKVKGDEKKLKDAIEVMSRMD